MRHHVPVVEVAELSSSTCDGENTWRGTSADTLAPLFEEVDRLVKCHGVELHNCLDRHLRGLQAIGHGTAKEPHGLLKWSKSGEFFFSTTEAPRQQVQHVNAPGSPAGDPHPLAPCEVLETGHCVSEPSEVGPTKQESVMSVNSESANTVPQSLQLPQKPTSRKTSPSPSLVAITNKTDKTADEIAAKKRRTTSKKKHTFIDLFPQTTEMVEQSQSMLQRMTSSRYYEYASGTLICMNAIFLGWQTQHMANYAEAAADNNMPLEEGIPGSFLALQVAFTLIFSAELGLRWVCDGLIGFFQDTDRWWNVLDVAVVSFSVLDLVMHFAIQQEDILGNFSVLRVLRVVRIVRVARVIRIMRFFRELRMMIFSILRSMKSLLWVILVLGVTFYVFGITFTVATTTELDTTAKWRSQTTLGVRQYFGTLDRSILSLFMAMSGGNDWSVYYEALGALPVQYQVLFLLYVSFAIFAVVNIVTGVFVETAMQSNTEDRDVTVHEELENKKIYLRQMREIFEEMDNDDTGSISIDEFESKLDDERVVAYFNAMKLDVSDARMLFFLLDYDQSGEVSINEFLTGCYKLQGDSRSLDTKLMQCEVRFLRESFTVFSQTLSRVDGTVSDLCAKRHP